MTADAIPLLKSYFSFDFNHPRIFCNNTPVNTIEIVASTGDKPNISMLKLY